MPLTGCCAGWGAGLQPQQRQASCQTSGIPPLVHSAVLTDRRHVLTKDAEGNVQLWDIATGAVEQHFGKVWIVTDAVFAVTAVDCRMLLECLGLNALERQELPFMHPAQGCALHLKPALPCPAQHHKLHPLASRC